MKILDIRERWKQQLKQQRNSKFPPSIKKQNKMEQSMVEKRIGDMNKHLEDKDETIRNNEKVKQIQHEIEENDLIIQKRREINKMLVAAGDNYIHEIDEEYEKDHPFDYKALYDLIYQYIDFCNENGITIDEQIWHALGKVNRVLSNDTSRFYRLDSPYHLYLE